jgi:hypothetical protein
MRYIILLFMIFFIGDVEAASDCANGQYHDQTGCKSCAIGKHDHDFDQETPCTDCGSGRYQNQQGTSSCKTCSPGSITDKLANSGSKSCTMCPAGQYSGVSTSACQICSTGSITDKLANRGASSCTDCGVGQYSTASTVACNPCLECTEEQFISVECEKVKNRVCENIIDCEAGQYQTEAPTRTSNRKCSSCPNGKYQEQMNKESCKFCEAGKEFTTKSTVCTDCASGKFQSVGNALSDSCQDCLVGKYQAEKGQASCTDCAAGKYQSQKGKTSCTSCLNVEYQAEKGQESCTPCTTCTSTQTVETECSATTNRACVTWCKPGEKQTKEATKEDGSDRECKPCEAGKYQDIANHAVTICKTCSPGSVTDNLVIEGSKSCTACPASKYSDVSTSACQNCEDGSYTNTLLDRGASNCTDCGAGTYSADSTVACVACSAGSITEIVVGTGAVSSKATTCTECAAGQYSGQSTEDCQMCGVGQFSIKTECSQCPLGYYQDQSEQTLCKECLSGKYQNLAGKSSCNSCGAGQYASSRDAGSTGGCNNCQRGKYQSETPSVEYHCKFCAAGTEFVSTALECNTCADGKYQDENDKAIAECEFCAAGTEFTSTTSRCDACNGKYQDKNDEATATCKFCPVGTKFSDPTAICSNCQKGKYQSESSKSDAVCKDCDVGKFSDVRAPTCSNCAFNTYTDQRKSSSCKNCELGKSVEKTGSDNANDCEWNSCVYQDGLTPNNFNCFCSSGSVKNECDASIPTCNTDGICTVRQCENIVGSEAVDKKCKCGTSGIYECLSGDFCFNPGIEGKITCDNTDDDKPDCGCSSQRKFTCDILTIQVEYPDRDPASQIIQDESCSCGNTICFKNEYCNEDSSLCSSTPSQKCIHNKGLKVNPSACLCGDKSCDNGGYYCDSEENKCFKKLCASYDDLDQLCDRPGYGNGVLLGNPQCANTWCDLDDFETCCKQCPLGNEVIDGKCRRKCTGMVCYDNYADPILSVDYNSISYTGYCAGSSCHPVNDLDRCCWEKAMCSDMTSDYCYLSKYTGNILDSVTCDDFQCTAEKCCETRECYCSNGVAAQGRACPEKNEQFCVDCDVNYWLYNKECVPVSICSGLQYQRLDYTTFSDRICESIDECGSGYYESTTPAEKGGMFIENRVCSPLATCLDSQYEKTSPTDTTNRICASVTVCNSTQYQTKAPTTTSDRECVMLREECSLTEYEESPPNATSDKICRAISGICSKNHYEQSAPNATSDRICKDINDCNYATQYRVAPSTNISDTQCANLRQCLSNEYEISPGNITHNRICQPLTVCTDREYEESPPNTTSDRICTLLTRCLSNEYEITAATKFTDRECITCAFDGCFGCKNASDCYYNSKSQIHNQSMCFQNTCTVINDAFTGNLKSGEWFRVPSTDIVGITPLIEIDHVDTDRVFYIEPEDIDKLEIIINDKAYNIVQDCKYERKWFGCSTMCGVGNKLGVRGKLIRPALHGGLPCASIPKMITLECIGTFCPINCTFTWDDSYGACEAPCGQKGLKYKKYNITQQPKYDGKKCPAYDSTECTSEPPEGFCDCFSNKNDACGICGGLNLTCVGCDGIPNSGKIKDHCGKCVNPTEACSLQSIRHEREQRSKKSKTLKIIVPVATGSTLLVVVMAILIFLCCRENKEYIKKQHSKLRSSEYRYIKV